MALKEMGARGFTAWCWARGFVPLGRTERNGACYLCCDLVSRDRGVEVGDCSFGMVTAVSITHELP